MVLIEGWAPEAVKAMPALFPNLVDKMVEQSVRVVDILTTTPTSRTKARKVNGGKKPPEGNYDHVGS
jgi:hypothetical protein